MLLQNKTTQQTDYLADWPAHYYEIPTGTGRRTALEQAKKQGLTTPADSYRRKYCDKRFFSRNNTGNIDTFMHAWMMIKASSAAGISLFQKKRLTRELKGYMEALCLLPSQPLSQEEQAVLMEEWQDFACSFLFSCTDSKAYRSTLFGFVPIKDNILAEKIAAEILLVTKEYPAKLHLSEEFLPFHQVMRDACCQMIEGSEVYFH